MELSKIAQVMSAAATLPNGNENGMKISFFGVLAHAGRAIDEVSAPLEGMDLPEEAVALLADEWEKRLFRTHASLHSYSLKELSKHMGMLKEAFSNGDAATVKQFFDLYVFD